MCVSTCRYISIYTRSKTVTVFAAYNKNPQKTVVASNGSVVTDLRSRFKAKAAKTEVHKNKVRGVLVEV